MLQRSSTGCILQSPPVLQTNISQYDGGPPPAKDEVKGNSFGAGQPLGHQRPDLWKNRRRLDKPGHLPAARACKGPLLRGRQGGRLMRLEGLESYKSKRMRGGKDTSTDGQTKMLRGRNDVLDMPEKALASQCSGTSVGCH